MNNSNNFSIPHLLTFMLLVGWAVFGTGSYLESNNAFSEETKKQRLFRYVTYGPFAWVTIIVAYLHAAIYKALGK
jgi:hypothetical protein